MNRPEAQPTPQSQLTPSQYKSGITLAFKKYMDLRGVAWLKKNVSRGCGKVYENNQL